MRSLMFVGVSTVLVFSGALLLAGMSPSPASSTGSSDEPGPRALMASVTANAPKECTKIMASTRIAGSYLLSVSPDKKRVFYALRTDDDRKWEMGILDPVMQLIKYSGSTDNGFGATGVVWSPQSDELALGVGYEGAKARWVRIGVATHDVKIAKILDEVAAAAPAQVAEIREKAIHDEQPVWGADGRYYDNPQLAEKNGIVTFQRGETWWAADPASRVILFGQGKREYTVLTDNVAKVAHIFSGTRYVDSFPLAGPSVNGWWFMSRPDGRLIAAKQFGFAESDGTTRVNPAAPVQWRWGGVDVGVGRIERVYEVARGLVLQIQRPPNTVEAVFLDSHAVERALTAKE